MHRRGPTTSLGFGGMQIVWCLYYSSLVLGWLRGGGGVHASLYRRSRCGSMPTPTVQRSHVTKTWKRRKYDPNYELCAAILFCCWARPSAERPPGRTAPQQYRADDVYGREELPVQCLDSAALQEVQHSTVWVVCSPVYKLSAQCMGSMVTSFTLYHCCEFCLI